MVAFGGEDAALGGALEEAFLDEVGFVDFFEGGGFFADGDGDGAEADGAAVEVLGDGEEDALIHFVEAEGVDF